MKKEIKSKINILMEIRKSIWATDEFGRHIFFKENTSKIETTTLDKKYFSVYGNVELNGKHYEACIFNAGVDGNFIKNLFNLIAESKDSIKSSITDIVNYFADSSNLDLEMVRGVVAEITAINLMNLKENHKTSIYDFVSNGIDFEVKSFSKTKRDIIVSYQQLTNSVNAKLMAIEVFESSEGKTVVELINGLENLGSRYAWILGNNSEYTKTKFKAEKHYIFEMSELSEGLSMPVKSKAAKFIFGIDSLINK